MKLVSHFFCILVLVTFSSCSFLVYKEGAPLNKNNFEKLNGSYSNYIKDTTKNDNSLWSAFKGPPPFGPHNTRILLEPIDEKTIRIKLYSNDSLINKLDYKGVYKRGGFKLKTDWTPEGVLGPVFWTLSRRGSYLCLDKNSNLIILQENFVTFFLLIVPLMEGSSRHNIEYQRIKTNT